jgi:hypothetical protein
MQGAVDTQTAKRMGEFKPGNIVAAGMDRLLQDESSDSYKTGYNILFGMVALLTVVLCVATFILWYTVKQGRQGDQFAAMSFDGKRMWLTSLSTPSLNTAAMCSWASQAATDVMTFGFDDINERMGSAKKYFTEVGYQSFVAAAQSSGIIKMVMTNQQLVTAIPGGPAILGYEGIREGEYVWEIEVPLVLTVRAGDQRETARPTLLLTLVRVPTAQNPSGFGIQQWIMF